MNAPFERLETVAPTESDARLASHAFKVLASQLIDGQLRLRLDDGTPLHLSRSATTLFLRLLAELGQGNAVSVVPIHAEMTTQEAAEFLNVSRPYLIKLLEQGEIRFHKAGTHRRIRFTDIDAFKRKFEKQRDAVMRELAAQAQDLKLGY